MIVKKLFVKIANHFGMLCIDYSVYYMNMKQSFKNGYRACQQDFEREKKQGPGYPITGSELNDFFKEETNESATFI